MAVLGVSPQNVIVGKFETRRFPHFRQEILEYLIDSRTATSRKSSSPTRGPISTRTTPPSPKNACVPSAARPCWAFDVLRSSYGFFPNFLVEVTEKDVEAKVNALAEYKTYASKYYFDPAITRATLIRHGALAERPYAEGFDILRVIGKFEK